MNPISILIIDDDADLLRLLSTTASREGFKPTLAGSLKDALTKLDQSIPQVVLLDLQLPDGSGFDFLREAKRLAPQVPVIILSAVDRVRDAVLAMQLGARDYLTKPSELKGVFGRLREVTEEPVSTERPLRPVDRSSEAFFGESSEALELIEHAQKVAPLPSTVLITGESGVGKGVLARMIHERSPQRGRPFVTVSCPVLPHELIESELFGHEKGAFTGATSRRAGKVELAEGGTIFFDEIGDLPLSLQPKLVTLLQEREYSLVGSSKLVKASVRVIAATNQPLKEMVEQGAFRTDLYYRLAVIPLEVPPLRVRGMDLDMLVAFIGERVACSRNVKACSFSDEAMTSLREYTWPGNVRELENVIELSTAYCSGGVVELRDLPEEIRGRLPEAATNQTAPEPSEAAPSQMRLVDIEYQAILQALEACDGNRAKAAERLGVSEKTIYNKLKKRR